MPRVTARQIESIDSQPLLRISFWFTFGPAPPFNVIRLRAEPYDMMSNVADLQITWPLNSS